MKLGDVLQSKFKGVGNHPAAPGLGNGAHGQLVRRGIDVIDPDAGKALLEFRKNLLRIDLRQRTVAVKNALFLKRLLIDLINRFT